MMTPTNKLPRLVPAKFTITDMIVLLVNCSFESYEAKNVLNSTIATASGTFQCQRGKSQSIIAIATVSYVKKTPHHSKPILQTPKNKVAGRNSVLGSP